MAFWILSFIFSSEKIFAKNFICLLTSRKIAVYLNQKLKRKGMDRHFLSNVEESQLGYDLQCAQIVSLIDGQEVQGRCGGFYTLTPAGYRSRKPLILKIHAHKCEFDGLLEISDETKMLLESTYQQSHKIWGFDPNEDTSIEQRPIPEMNHEADFWHIGWKKKP